MQYTYPLATTVAAPAAVLMAVLAILALRPRKGWLRRQRVDGHQPPQDASPTALQGGNSSSDAGRFGRASSLLGSSSGEPTTAADSLMVASRAKTGSLSAYSRAAAGSGAGLAASGTGSGNGMGGSAAAAALAGGDGAARLAGSRAFQPGSPLSRWVGCLWQRKWDHPASALDRHVLAGSQCHSTAPKLLRMNHSPAGKGNK